MYLLNGLILFSPLMFYSFFRIRKLFVHRAVKTAFTAFFAFLALGYPVAEFLSHGTGTGWSRFIMMAGYYALPFLLYMVMTVVLFDLILGAARLLKFVSSAVMQRSGFVFVQLCVFLVTPAVIVLAGRKDGRLVDRKSISD